MRSGRRRTDNMRTVRRQSLKLNKAKFDALERIARAFASDKQTHLDFYQHGLNFSEAPSYRLRRSELKTTNHHASTPLPVHASDLALKEAFETEVKYWAAIASEIHHRIASRQWTDEQKHYAGSRCHVDHVTKVHSLKFDLVKPISHLRASRRPKTL